MSDNKENTTKESLEMEVHKPGHTFKDDLKQGMKDVLHVFQHHKSEDKSKPEENKKNPFEEWNVVLDD